MIDFWTEGNKESRTGKEGSGGVVKSRTGWCSGMDSFFSPFPGLVVVVSELGWIKLN